MIKVITPPADEPITLQEAKDHLRVVIDDEDTYIESLITAARQMAEGRLNRLLMPQVVQFSAPLAGTVTIPRPPLRDLDSVAYIDGDGAAQALDPAAYVLDEFTDPPRVTAAYGTPWPAVQPGSAATIQYQAGYASAADVPRPIIAWILLAIGSLYENRESVVAGVSVTALPPDFMALLLQPYMVYE